MWVISKGEHPWIGYPDAIGHTINNTKIKLRSLKMSNPIENFDRIHKSPLRQESQMVQFPIYMAPSHDL